MLLSAFNNKISTQSACNSSFSALCNVLNSISDGIARYKILNLFISGTYSLDSFFIAFLNTKFILHRCQEIFPGMTSAKFINFQCGNFCWQSCYSAEYIINWLYKRRTETVSVSDLVYVFDLCGILASEPWQLKWNVQLRNQKCGKQKFMVRIPDLTQLYRVNSNHFRYFACFYLHYRLRSRAKRNGFKFSSGKSIYYREIINKRIRCTESGLNDLILAVEHIARVSRKN